MNSLCRDSDQRRSNSRAFRSVSVIRPVSRMSSPNDTIGGSNSALVTSKVESVGATGGIAEKVASEVTSMCGDRFPTYEDFRKLKYSRAFVSEVLRLHPPLFMVVRQCISDDEVMGYRIPAKATVAVPLCRLHRHPDYWDRPDEFIPERFLAKPWVQDNEFAYMPFIVGKRNCIGRNFIFLAMSLITGELSRRFRFSLPPAFKIKRDQTYIVYDGPTLDTINVQPRRRGN